MDKATEEKTFVINGMGRIGRLVLREYMRRKSPLKILAVNDLSDIDTLLYLIRYDSVHGRLKQNVSCENNRLIIGDYEIPVLSEGQPEKLPWGSAGVDWVLESTGRFRQREDAAKHLQAGAKKVLISAPSESADLTLIHGVNNNQYDAVEHQVISNGSCTTNSLAPPLAVLHDCFNVESANATTIHAYTSSQGLVDVAARKRIRGRAAALNLVPTSTGADKVITHVFPFLRDKFAALAVRVPIANGGLSDITILVKEKVTVQQVNSAFLEASKNSLRGVLGYTDEEWVSSDIIGNPLSAIVHGLATRVVADHQVKIQVWYDNEYAYACRLLDLMETLSLNNA